MRTHPKIAETLRKELTPECRKAVEQANEAHKLSRAYHGHGSSHKVTRSEVIASMHASLIIAGVENINGMDLDVWIMRSIRDYNACES